MTSERPAPDAPDVPEEAARPKFGWMIIPMALVTALVIYVLVDRLAGAEAFGDAFETVSWELLLASVAVLAGAIFLSCVRFHIIVSALAVRLPLGRALDAILAAWPLALVTPSRANDLLRAVAIRDLLPIAEGTSTVVAERLVDFQSLAVLSLVGAAILGTWEVLLMALLVLVAVWVGALMLLAYHEALARLPLIRRFEKLVPKLLAALEALKQHPRHFLVLAAVSLLTWGANTAICYLLLLAFHADVTPLQVLACWPVAIFVGMLPLTVAGMGTRDGAFVYLVLLTAGDVAEAPVLAATFSYAAVTSWLPALVGIAPMVRHMRALSRRPATPAEPAEPG